MTKPNGSVAAIALFAALTSACAGATLRSTLQNPTPTDVAQLWQEPLDLASRDVFHGPGSAALAPDPSTPFTFVAADTTGHSPGYDVRGPDGTVWSVKLGHEAQPEVAVSRILWAIGYHQPPTYYLDKWTLTGTQAGPQPAGRFRPTLPSQKVVGDWPWYENDFATTRAYKGLVAANVLLNNWDWKTSNNKVYEVTGGAGTPNRVYVVRDLGASLGKTSFKPFLNWGPWRMLPMGSRNDIDGFEEQDFVKRVDGARVELHYRGVHTSLVKSLSVQDVLWMSELMSRLSDAQLADAFRAAGYPPDVAARYIAKIKAKVAEGLTLGQPARQRAG